MEIAFVVVISNLLFTAVLAFATVFYAHQTRELARQTGEIQRTNQEVLKAMLISTMSELPEYRRVMGPLLEGVFGHQIREILWRVQEGPGLRTKIADLIRSIEDDQLRAMVQEGKLKEAIAAATNRYQEDPSAGTGYIEVLVTSDNTDDWSKAWGVFKADPRSENLKHMVALAYLYHTKAEFETAIEILERGIEVARTKGCDEPTLGKIKNSLAYYYAIEQRPEKAEDAKRLASEAYDQRKDAATSDTLGFVLITFGTPAEIAEGISLCTEAFRQVKDHHPEATQFYSRAMQRAAERLATA